MPPAPTPPNPMLSYRLSIQEVGERETGIPCEHSISGVRPGLTSGITAKNIIRLLEENAQARKRLAKPLVSKPDVRLAIINAVLSDVATKQDLGAGGGCKARPKRATELRERRTTS